MALPTLNDAERSPDAERAEQCWKQVLHTTCALDSTVDLDAYSAHIVECFSLISTHPRMTPNEQLALQRKTLHLIDFLGLLKEAKALTCASAKHVN